MNIVIRQKLRAIEWDAVVNTSPDGWVFSLWNWQELILQVQKWGLIDLSFGVKIDGKLVAIVPLQYNPNTKSLSSTGWGGGGPIIAGNFAPKQHQSIMKYLIDYCKELAESCGASKIDFSVSPVSQSSLDQRWGVNPFEMFGMRDRSRLTQVIDLLPSQEMLWSGLSALAKRKIRKARSLGYSVNKFDWVRNIDSYYEIHVSTYLRTGEVPHPREYFAGIAHKLSRPGYSVLWGAQDKDGNVGAFHNMARFKEGAYYHTGCSTAVAAASGANYLLFWESMLGAKSMGVRWYDAGWIFPHGASEKQIGLSHFKTRFGGEVHRSFFGELELSDQCVKTCEVTPQESTFPNRPVHRFLSFFRMRTQKFWR